MLHGMLRKPLLGYYYFYIFLFTRYLGSHSTQAVQKQLYAEMTVARKQNKQNSP